MPFPLSRVHRARLLQLWRSAGWPCRDPIELDLLAQGLLVEQTDPQGRVWVQLTAAGLAALQAERHRARRTAGPHDLLARRFASRLLAEGRLVWRELALRAPLVATGLAPPALSEALWPQETPGAVPVRWRVARPDLFSVRHTSREDSLQPAVHEIKVSRADLLAELRNDAKRAAYEALGGSCHYVFPVGIADPDEVPAPYGVWVLHGLPDDARAPFEQVRAARHVHRVLPFSVWMALAKAVPFGGDDDPAQPLLGEA